MMTRKIRVSAISYLNTAPFVFGLQHSDILKDITITFDYPAECARKLQCNESDIGIIPVAALLALPKYEIVSNYCIGATGPVRTVTLLSNSPLNRIEKVYLDYQSRTSVRLARILSRYYWKIEPEWAQHTPQHNANHLADHEAIVIIGDRVFDAEKRYRYCIDLADEWLKFTGLPFVFAVWAAVVPLQKSFTESFNNALEMGINNIPLAVDGFSPKSISNEEAVEYFRKNISFTLDDKKKEAIDKFLSLVAENNL